MGYKQAIELDNENASVFYNLGMVLAKQKKWEDSVTNLNKAISLKSDYHKAYYKLSEVFKFQQKYDDALNNAKTALELDPQNAGYKSNVEAIEQLKKAGSQPADSGMPGGLPFNMNGANMQDMIANVMNNPQAMEMASRLVGSMTADQRDNLANMIPD